MTAENQIRPHLNPSSEPVCRFERYMYSGVFPFSVSPTTNPLSSLVVVLSVGIAVVVVVGQEEVLVGAVAGKGDGRDAEAGE